MTLDESGNYAYYWTNDLSKIYFNLPTIAKRIGHIKKAKLINDFFLREILCIEGLGDYDVCEEVCAECPVEKIINRVVM